MQRGDVYYANLGIGGVGSEQVGSRPVVIIQNDIGNKYSPTVIVALITSQINKAKLPTHVEIHNDKIDPSVILCEQIRTIDKSRLGCKLFSLTNNDLVALNKALAISIDLINQKI